MPKGRGIRRITTVMKIKLTIPSKEMKPQAMAFRQEFIDAKEAGIPGSRDLMGFESYGEWLDSLKPKIAEETPSITFFAFRQPDGVLVGSASIRMSLTKETLEDGHVELSIRPSQRNKGYGSEVLRQVLDRARELGIMEVFASCGKKNRPAAKIMKKNGMERNGMKNGNLSGLIIIYSKDV
ncbi:MAG: GNAT family N-acetyltransferase [Clostridiales bacterium]|jgi:predicted acetyltransferase|nr:GNAT family N-acetyltransferase [Clostridiales bacterium]